MLYLWNTVYFVYFFSMSSGYNKAQPREFENHSFHPCFSLSLFLKYIMGVGQSADYAYTGAYDYNNTYQNDVKTRASHRKN